MAVDPRHKQQAYHSLFGYKQKLREYVSQQIDLSIYIDENEDLMHPNAYQEIRQMLISLQQGNGELYYQHTAGKENMYSLIHAENWEIDAYIKKWKLPTILSQERLIVSRKNIFHRLSMNISEEKEDLTA